MSIGTQVMVEQHKRKYPGCDGIRENCKHWRRYSCMVIFEEPDNGFIGTAEAFDEETAKEVIRAGVRTSHPGLHIKRLEVSL